MLLQLIFIGLGLTLLMKGADFLVDGSSKIAKRFHIPEIVIGLTLVSIGTSLPELVISVDSATKGFSDIALGNVVGSNISNLFLIISLCAVIKPIAIKRETKYFESPFVVLCTAIFYLVSTNDGIISRYEGIAFLVMVLLYLLYSIVMARIGNQVDREPVEENTAEETPKGKRKNAKVKEKQEETFKEKAKAIAYSILQIVIGIVALKFGGDLVVDNAVLIAEGLGISKKLISITIVAFGTSLPELITCVSATRRNESDLAIGNIVGSQIINIVLIIGLSAVLSPIQNARSYEEEILILLIGNLIFALLPFIGEKDKVGRASGLAFVIFYFIYMANLVVENLQW